MENFGDQMQHGFTKHDVCFFSLFTATNVDKKNMLRKAVGANHNFVCIQNVYIPCTQY